MNNPIPVIIGVGQVNDRESLGKAGLGFDSLGLMEAALRAADHDAGGGWLPMLDSLAVVDQISWPELGDVSLAKLRAFSAILPKVLLSAPYFS